MILIILILGCAAMAATSLLVIALGAAASRADDEMDELIAGDAQRAATHSYAGLTGAQSAISPEPSTTVPLSSTSVGTLPLGSFTSRRPRVSLHTPGSAPGP
jgi:hypothetical protein